MEGETDVTRSMIDQLHSSYIQGDQMEEGEIGLTRSIFNELPFGYPWRSNGR